MGCSLQKGVLEMLSRVFKWIFQILLLVLFGILLLLQRITGLDIFQTKAWYLYVFIILFGVAQFIILLILKKTKAHVALSWICFVFYIFAACMNFLFLALLKGQNTGLPLVCLELDLLGIYLSYYFLNNRPMNGVFCVSLIVLMLFSFCVFGIIAPTVRKLTAPVPPDLEAANSVYVEYREEINLIADYLIDTEYEYVFIADHIEDGFMYADYEYAPITDERVTKAIHTVLEHPEFFDSIRKRAGSITFSTATIHDVTTDNSFWYSIGRTVDGSGEPTLHYTTEVLPLVDEGWFFIIGDENAWNDAWHKIPPEERGR